MDAVGYWVIWMKSVVKSTEVISEEYQIKIRRFQVFAAVKLWTVVLEALTSS
jgi:hypothetical protein